MTERDPLDDADLPLEELRRAWSRIEPPRPDSELAHTDERTRAAVEWMQSAWSRVEAPAPVLPARILPFSRAQRLALPLAAAAGALLALGIWFALQRFAPGVRPVDMEHELTAAAESTDRDPTDAGPALAEGVQVASLAADRLEVCSGSVCLILLTPPSSPSTP
jgi:hypothetical protein